MKTPRIVNAVGHIDDELISGAIGERARKKSVWLKWGSVAACFAIILVAVAVVAPMMLGGPPIDNDGTVNPGPAEDLWLEKYYDYGINEGKFSSYIGGNVISEDRVGSKIEDVAVTAGWKNEAGEWLSTEALNAAVYEIDGIKSDVAVALKFIDKGEAVTTTHYYVIMHPNAEYNGMLFPDYKAENPVRYLDESDMGKSNGWQDFGLNGEIRTITVPIGSTYVYQMYSYYIRNDFTHIYSDEDLPDKLEKLPKWLTDTATVGRRSFWYSMGGRIPENVTLELTAAITSEDGSMNFIKAEYKIQIKDGASKKEENWVVYFMEEEGVYSAFAVVANENFDFVKSYSQTIVKSYQKKQ